MDALLADDGTPLATINSSQLTADRSVWFKILSERGPVLDFYFHQGGRRAWVVAGGSVLRGQLKTRWVDGRRLWRLASVTAANASPAANGSHGAVAPGHYVLAGGRENPRVGPGDPLAKGPTALPPVVARGDTPGEIYARSAQP
jgi:hypothetical protein